MLQLTFLNNFVFGETIISSVLKNPIYSIITCLGFWTMFGCLRNRYFGSFFIMALLNTLLIAITFTNVLADFLDSISKLLQYGSVIILIVLFCLVYDYEASHKQ